MRRFGFAYICLLIIGCSAPALRTVAPPPNPITVAYTPSLEPIMVAFHSCTNTHPELTIIVDKRSASTIDFKANDLTLWFGEKPEEANYATPLTDDELVLIANQANPNKELTLDEVRSLFAGQIENWSEISNYERPVSVWIYPEGNLLQLIISELLEKDRYSSLAHLTPNPKSMLEAIISDRGGIGFLPRLWLNNEASQIHIIQEMQGSLRRPILALTKTEPQGNIHTLLTCLQTGVGRDALLELLSPNN